MVALGAVRVRLRSRGLARVAADLPDLLVVSGAAGLSAGTCASGRSGVRSAYLLEVELADESVRRPIRVCE
jgi:hypothetical protein